MNYSFSFFHIHISISTFLCSLFDPKSLHFHFLSVFKTERVFNVSSSDCTFHPFSCAICRNLFKLISCRPEYPVTNFFRDSNIPNSNLFTFSRNIKRKLKFVMGVTLLNTITPVLCKNIPGTLAPCQRACVMCMCVRSSQRTLIAVVIL